MSTSTLLTVGNYVYLTGSLGLTAHALDSERQKIGKLSLLGPSRELSVAQIKATSYVFGLASIALFRNQYLSNLMSAAYYSKTVQAQSHEYKSSKDYAWQTFYVFGTVTCIAAAILSQVGPSLAIASGVAKGAAIALTYMEVGLFAHTAGKFASNRVSNFLFKTTLNPQLTN